MQVLLRDLAPGQEYAISFRSNDGKGNTSDWSQVQRFTTTDDTMPPADVQNLSVFTQDSSFFVQWDAVTLNQDGTPLKDLRSYHIHVSEVGTSGTADFYSDTPSFELTKAQNATSFGVFQSALTFTVTAVDIMWNESTHPNSVTLNPSAPATPSAPTVGNYVGLLLVSWDGLSSSGGVMPGNFSYCEVHVSTTSGFTPTSATLKGTLNLSTPSYIVPGLTYDTTYYVRLVAINLLGLKSGASAQGSGHPTRISGLDISNGQISAAQINFTAYDIGGSNAYYSTSQPTTTTAPNGFQKGDIWYDIDNGYATARYDGTTWQPAPEVGIISGTKIIAGTVTANAVGTNLLITSSANIGTAVIDQANIGSVNAGSITAGTLSANIILSGKFATALTGARREMNSSGFQAWDASNNQIINLDGVNNLLTGSFQTALTGRRVQIAAAGSSGLVSFTSPTAGVEGHVWNYAESGGVESMQMGFLVSGAGNIFWNSVHVNTDQWSSYNANRHSFTIGGANSASGADATRPGFFNVLSTSNYGTSGSITRLLIDNTNTNGFMVYDRFGGARLQINGTGITYYDAFRSRLQITDTMTLWDNTGQSRMQMQSGTNAQTSFFINDSGGSTSLGVVVFKPGVIASGSPAVIMLNSAGNGGGFDYALSTNNMQVVDPFLTGYIGISASAFNVSSDVNAKDNVKVATDNFSAMVMGTVPNRYTRKKSPSAPKNYIPQEELGLIAQQAPPQIVKKDDQGMFLVDHYQMTTVLWGALREALARLDKLEGK